MSVDKLTSELNGLKQLAKGKRVCLWITPAAGSHMAGPHEDLIAIMASAFTKSAGELGRWSEPSQIWHSEDPDMLFVGVRLRPTEPYLFVAQTLADGTKYYRLIKEAFGDANKG